MGESQGRLCEPAFNPSVKVVESDDRITSDAGVLVLRETDHHPDITESLANDLHDPRHPDLIRSQTVELLRERVYDLALDYSTHDDGDRLTLDRVLPARLCELL